MIATTDFPTTLPAILIYIAGLAILWLVNSIPVYLAGKALTSGKADFGDAMGATLGGAIAYLVVFFAISFFLGPVIGGMAQTFALILGLFVWFSVFRAVFRTTWVRALGIVVVSWGILIIVGFVTAGTVGTVFPDFFPF